MKILNVALSALLFLPSVALAQVLPQDLIGLGIAPEVASYLHLNGLVQKNNTFIKQRNAAGTANISVLKVDSNDDTILNADSGDVGTFSVATTPVAGFATVGLTLPAQKGLRMEPYVPTMAATPAAGTNDFKPGLNVVPTAAANTAACLAAVPSPGDSYEIFNNGPNAIRVKACGTPGINGAAAGSYIPLATFQKASCHANSATAYLCDVKTVPTPAGP